MHIRILIALAGLMMAPLAEGVPYSLSYSGRLVESSGKPVTDSVALRVSFYRSETGSDFVPIVVPDFPDVKLSEGIFLLNISLDPADFHVIFNANDPVWIQIKDVTHDITYPRQKFSAVPYALKVPVDGESITYNSEGELALGNGSNILKLPATAGTLDKVLKSDGAGGLVWADDLSGGGAGTITSTEIQNGTITNDDIAGGAAIVTSKLSGAVTAISGHGLGDSATKNVGTTAGTVAEGNHGHGVATTGAAGFMSAADKSKLDGIAAGAGVDTNSNAKTLCADGEYLRGEDGSDVCRTAGQIVSEGAGVKTTDTGTVTSTMIADGTITKDDIATSAVESAEILDGTIVNDDISPSAAIAGTKISPNFGSQNITTTGTVTGVGSGLTKVIVPGHIYGLVVSWASSDSVNVSAGSAVSDDHTTYIDVPSQLTFAWSNGVGQPNGSQTAEASDSMYDVYVIADSSSVNAPAVFAVVSGTAVSLPTGYDKKRLVGAFRNNGSGSIVGFTQIGKGSFREFLYDSMVVLVDDASDTVFTVADASNLMPASSNLVILRASLDYLGDGGTLYLIKAGSPDGTGYNMMLVSSNSTYATSMVKVGTLNRTFRYRVTNASLQTDIRVAGFVMDL